MSTIEFTAQRIKDNEKLGELLIALCIKYDLRLMQLIDIINQGGDYFNEEPGRTIDRVLQWDRQNIEKQKANFQ